MDNIVVIVRKEKEEKECATHQSKKEKKERWEIRNDSIYRLFQWNGGKKVEKKEEKERRKRREKRREKRKKRKNFTRDYYIFDITLK